MDGDIRHVIHWNGSSVQSVRKAFDRARDRAGLDRKVVRHSLRHSCATWLMQAGVSIWDAAGFLGMTPQMVQDVYGHHAASFMDNAANAIGRA